MASWHFLTNIHWSFLWTYTVAISNTIFPTTSTFSQLNKLLVLMHIAYTHVLFHHTNIFQNAFDHLINLINVSMYMATLMHPFALISDYHNFHFRHYAMVCWNSTNLLPHGLPIHIHYYSRTAIPALSRL